MSRKNAYGALMQAAAQQTVKRMIAEQTMARLQIGRDAAVLAAHKVFGLGPGRAQAFADAYSAAMDELATLFVDDGASDETLEYAKAKRDEAIRAIVGDELFVPFDRAYGDAYMDELKRIRIRGGNEGQEA